VLPLFRFYCRRLYLYLEVFDPYTCSTILPHIPSPARFLLLLKPAVNKVPPPPRFFPSPTSCLMRYRFSLPVPRSSPTVTHTSKRLDCVIFSTSSWAAPAPFPLRWQGFIPMPHDAISRSQAETKECSGPLLSPWMVLLPETLPKICQAHYISSSAKLVVFDGHFSF